MKYLKILNKLFPWQWKYYTCPGDWLFMFFWWGSLVSAVYSLFDPLGLVVTTVFLISLLANLYFSK